MNDRPNYNEGSARNVIIKLLCANGVLPYRFLKYTPYNIRYIWDVVHKMQEDGIVDIVRSKSSSPRKSKRLIVFKDYEKNKDTFEKGLPIDYQMLYEDVKYRSKNARFNQISEQERIYNIIEANLFFYWGGIPSDPDGRRRLVKFDDASDFAYYPIQEIKYATSYTDTVEMLPEKESNSYNKGKKVTGSKAVGLYTTPETLYTVYNVGNQPVKWAISGEKKIKLVTTVSKRGSEIDILPFNSCIVLTTGDKVLKTYIKGEEKSDSYSLDCLGRIYENVFVIKMDELGRKLIQIMAHKSYRQKILELILDENEITKDMKIDGYNSESNESILFGGIVSVDCLYAFYAAAVISKQKDDDMTYVLICFEEQEEMYEELLGNVCEIRTVGVDDIVNAAGFMII